MFSCRVSQAVDNDGEEIHPFGLHEILHASFKVARHQTGYHSEKNY